MEHDQDGLHVSGRGLTGIKAAAIKAYVAEFQPHGPMDPSPRLATLLNDIPFPPVARRTTVQPPATGQRPSATEFWGTTHMLGIEPDSGSMSSRHGGDSLTLWPVADCAYKSSTRPTRATCSACST